MKKTAGGSFTLVVSVFAFISMTSLSFPAPPSLSTSQVPLNGNDASKETARTVPGNHDLSITQSIDANNIVFGTSVNCNAAGSHTDNSYYRRFALHEKFGIDKKLVIKSVDLGIQNATGNGGSQPVEVRLYAIASEAALELGNLNMIGSASFSQADGNFLIENFKVNGIIDPLKDDLVVEFFIPDGQILGNSFFIGSNSSGQTGPSYIMASACRVEQPRDIATLGFPGMHIVMTVFADHDFPWPTFIPATTGAGRIRIQ